MTLHLPAIPVQELDDATLNFEALAAGPLATILVGVGAPAGSLGVDTNVFIRLDGAAGAFIYQKRAGAWVASAA